VIRLKALKYIYYVYVGLLFIGCISLILEGNFDIYSFLALICSGIAVYLIENK